MFSTTVLAVTALASAAQAITVNVGSTGGNASSPYQYGIMFEDINHSGDGGVYAELVQNRAFQGSSQYPSSLDYWYPIGGASLALKNLSTPLSSALPTSMQLSKSATSGNIGFWNEGYWGFPVVSNWTYEGSFYMKGNFKGPITVSLASNTTGKTLVQSVVNAKSVSGQWSQFNYTFKPTASAPDSNNTLQFTMAASDVKGNLSFNLLSLFPPTYNDRPNGLRVDLMQAMHALNPKLFRCPGGNNIEGNQAPDFWNWTNTIGPLKDRPGYAGTWGYENTNGLGLIEYMLWAKDIGMEPLLAVWSGLYLDGTVIPENELQPYVQLALDELEFLTGPASSGLGAQRAALGYPEPFVINFVEVGNEDNLNRGQTSYDDYRFSMFQSAIKEKYPNITVIASYYNTALGSAGDFHEYQVPQTISQQFTMWDNVNPEYPVLLGEYAVVEYDVPFYPAVTYGPGEFRSNYPFWYGSLAEAIYLLGSERNSNNVIASMYAPGFQNFNNWQWIPNNIQFDANPANTVLSTSWHTVQLLSGTRMTETLPMANATFDPAYYVAGRNNDTGSHVFKAVIYNSTGIAGQSTVPFKVNFDGVPAGAKGQLTWLTAPMNSSNTIGHDNVRTHTKSITANKNGTFSFSLPDWSIAVFETNATSTGHADVEKRSSWLAPRDFTKL